MRISVSKDFCHSRAEESSSFLDLMDRLNQLVSSGIFQDIAPGSSFYGADDISLVTVHTQDQHLGIRGALEDLGCSLDPVQLLHGDIHYSNVGLVLLRLLDGLEARSGFGHNLEIRLMLEDLA